MVLAFLGHDLLMTAPAQAATIPSLTDQHRSPSQTATHGESVEREPGAPEPNHPQDCGIGQWAVPRANDEPEVTRAELAPRGVCVTVSAADLTAASPWHEPGCSPAIRRALMQVYRI